MAFIYLCVYLFAANRTGRVHPNVIVFTRGEFMPRQTRQLPRTVDLKGRILSCQSY